MVPRRGNSPVLIGTPPVVAADVRLAVFAQKLGNVGFCVVVVAGLFGGAVEEIAFLVRTVERARHREKLVALFGSYGRDMVDIAAYNFITMRGRNQKISTRGAGFNSNSSAFGYGELLVLFVGLANEN